MESCVGVDVGGTKIHFYASHGGEVFEKRGLTGFSYSRAQLVSDIDSFVSSLPFDVRVVGVAVPAIVESNVVTVAMDSRGLEGFGGADFAGRPYSVHILNDIRAATVEEQQYYPPDSTLAVIINGTGVSVGISERGRILRGCRGYAGELGFIPLEDESGAVRDAQDLMCGKGLVEQSGGDLVSLLSRLEAHDASAEALVERAAHYFGLALATVVTLLNPEHVVLGGSMCRLAGYVERAKAVAREHCLYCSFEVCQFHAPHDADRVVVLGAMRHALLEAAPSPSAP